MFNTNNFKTLFLSVILLFVSACEDNHDHDHYGDGDGHTEASGFVIKDSSGTEVWKELSGGVTGIGLTAGYHAGNITQDALNNSFFDRAQRETGTVKDPEKESILTAHLETTKGKPTINTDAKQHESGYISQYGAKELGNAKYADDLSSIKL